MLVITANAGDIYKPISRTDIEMRGVNNSQEVLRIIPGIVIGQHQGGGKAEQIFLRGFDADHGTDFREDVDGLPINMVSHAHGQGFADSHFIIPETIESVDFKKGPYAAAKGDFATTGFVDFNTKNALDNNVVKVEGGMFNTFRVLGMFNLLSKGQEKNNSHGMSLPSTGIRMLILIIRNILTVSIYLQNIPVKFQKKVHLRFLQQHSGANGMRQAKSPTVQLKRD